MPARSAAIRATFMPCGPSGNAQPSTTSSSSAGATPGAAASAACRTVAASSSGRVARRLPLGALPTAELALATEATEEVEPLLALYRNSLPPRSLRVARTAESWRYWAWRNRLEVSQRLLEGGRLVGYATVVRDGDLLWVGDVAAPGIERPRVTATLRRLAERAGATRVAGWLPPELAGPPFAAVVRTRCIPMVAPLDGALASFEPELAHLSSLDCF